MASKVTIIPITRVRANPKLLFSEIIISEKKEKNILSLFFYYYLLCHFFVFGEASRVRTPNNLTRAFFNTLA